MASRAPTPSDTRAPAPRRRHRKGTRRKVKLSATEGRDGKGRFAEGNGWAVGHVALMEGKDVKEAARLMVENPRYRLALLERLIAGTAGGMEPVVWHYAHGKPAETLEVKGRLPFVVEFLGGRRDPLAEADAAAAGPESPVALPP